MGIGIGGGGIGVSGSSGYIGYEGGDGLSDKDIFILSGSKGRSEIETEVTFATVSTKVKGLRIVTLSPRK